MSRRAFNRTLSVIVSRSIKDRFFETVNETRITDLRMSFAIEKSIGDSPNTSSVAIFNLAERTRGEFQQPRAHCRIEAGYDGNLERLFDGDVTWCNQMHEGTEWSTKLQLSDGGRAYRHARVNRSFRAGTDVKKVVSELAKTMGLSLPKNVADTKEMLKQFASGISLQGPSQEEMTRVLKAQNMTWSVQDGTLQILPDNGLRPGQALVISQDTGLIGSPDYGMPKKGGKDRKMTAKMLLKPVLVPGCLVDMQSRSIRGAFKVTRVVHTGDTHGPEWTSEIEGVAL